MSRTFEARPATREALNTFTGLCGPSSSGKTYSALRLATGIQKVSGGEIYLIDTENRRATFYSQDFKFQHVQFDPPYNSAAYVEAIRHCEAQGAKIIVIDSASHEHEGEGGLLEAHEAEVDRLSRGNDSKREAVKMLAWNKPKQERRKLLRAITTSKAHIIMCFRSKHISKPVKVNGEAKVVDMGFVPIAGEEFVFEMQLCAMLPPNSRGVPNWNPEFPGEKMAVKLPRQFESFVHAGQAIDETLGQKLAEWARGAEKAPPATKVAADPDAQTKLLEAGKLAARSGTEKLKGWWGLLSKADQHTVGKDELAKLKVTAEEADEVAREKAEQEATHG